MIEEDNLTLAEIAAAVRVKPITVWRAVRLGLLKGQRIGNRRWIVARSDYLDWRARGAPTSLPKERKDERDEESATRTSATRTSATRTSATRTSATSRPTAA